MGNGNNHEKKGAKPLDVDEPPQRDVIEAAHKGGKSGGMVGGLIGGIIGGLIGALIGFFMHHV